MNHQQLANRRKLESELARLQRKRIALNNHAFIDVTEHRRKSMQALERREAEIFSELGNSAA